MVGRASKNGNVLADGKTCDVKMYTYGVYGKNWAFAAELAKYIRTDDTMAQSPPKGSRGPGEKGHAIDLI